MLWYSVWIECIFHCLNFWWVIIAWQQNLNQFQFLWQFIWIVDSVCYFQIHFEIFPLLWFFFSVYTNRNNVWFSTKTIAKRLKTLKKCFVYQKIVGFLFDLDELHEKNAIKFVMVVPLKWYMDWKLRIHHFQNIQRAVYCSIREVVHQNWKRKHCIPFGFNYIKLHFPFVRGRVKTIQFSVSHIFFWFELLNSKQTYSI